jgi:hypothetical protein
VATYGRATDVAIGALIGYDFGSLVLKLYVTDSIYTKDDFGAVAIWTKLSFKIWGPDAGSPANSVIRK